ncbi:hypothetical protein CCHR01_14194 [Colletotrichum chrysophilum]|uniref:Uncharacterized protein n=1 Tax=Colletotrichum chrysophilum TaxID=1836956 RepID=A0AAD9AAL8_9PEZI|nr:hypothetical protein CCHR01_14194 [Colletotrichum chrysophilum]
MLTADLLRMHWALQKPARQCSNGGSAPSQQMEGTLRRRHKTTTRGPAPTAPPLVLGHPLPPQPQHLNEAGEHWMTGVLSTLNGRADRSPKSQVGTEFPSWTQLPINSNVVHWVAGRFEETMLNGYVQLLHKAERME